MPNRFSHYAALKAFAYAEMQKRGEPVSDQMFYDAVQALNPAPLPDADMQALLTELDETRQRKKGRPTNNTLIRMELAARLERCESDIVPELLRASLVDRLRSGIRYAEFKRSQKADKLHEKRTRDMIIRGLYRDIYPQVKAGEPVVQTVLGPLDESAAAPFKAPSDKALAIVGDTMSRRLGLDPPSMGTMRNIIAAKKSKSKNVSV